MIVAVLTGLTVGLIGLVLAYLVYRVTERVCEKIVINHVRYHKIRVVSPDDSLFPTNVYLDGKKIEGVLSLNYHIGTKEIPRMTIELLANSIEIEGNYNVRV